MKLVFHLSGKVPGERNKLNKYAKDVGITNLQFLKNVLGSYLLNQVQDFIYFDILYLSVSLDKTNSLFS